MRRVLAPPDKDRCEADRQPLADGSGARCMHRKAPGCRYCAQHERIIYGYKGKLNQWRKGKTTTT
jgi:hypothetical protein